MGYKYPSSLRVGGIFFYPKTTRRPYQIRYPYQTRGYLIW
nr:MAG TPA: hypothetical protein [Caudoviricetes sp.]